MSCTGRTPPRHLALSTWAATAATALFALALSCGTAATAAGPATATKNAPTGKSAPPATAGVWDLTELYPTPEAWADELRATSARVEQLGRYKGTLGQNAAALRDALVAVSDLRRTIDRLGVYAGLGADADRRVAAGQERRSQAQAIEAKLGEQTAWIAPAVLELGEARVRAYLAEDTELQRRFGFWLDDTLRAKAHTLGTEAEAVLAAGKILLAQPDNVFGQLSDAELPRPLVRLSTGQQVRIDAASYEQHRTSAVRADRKQVMEAFFGSLRAFEGSFGANLNAQVLGDVYAARTRHFDTALDAALFDNNMPPEVYHQLVAQTHAALPTLHRYLRLRKRLLGITGDLAYHDNYPPLVPRPRGEFYDIDKSKAITLAALAPMGERYLSLLQRGFDGRWMHVAPSPGKASGAYMQGGAYDVHPYLLLNHNNDYASLSTFAHEWGHAVHTQLTTARQPYEKANYATFVAESASIANEMLLNDYLVAHASNRAEKLYFLSQGLEAIRTTFFRQVQFAEFQLAMHTEVEQGRPLSGARLSQLYCGLLEQYYGQAEGVMKIAPGNCIEWAYVGHFYYGYYVYQYATSIVGAAEFTEAIQRSGAPARERFITLLEAGGSDYPYALYRRAGIDLAQPQPYLALMARMNRLLDEFEALVAAPIK
jgi:oligoendopeptidase F